MEKQILFIPNGTDRFTLQDAISVIAANIKAEKEKCTVAIRTEDLSEAVAAGVKWLGIDWSFADNSAENVHAPSLEISEDLDTDITLIRDRGVLPTAFYHLLEGANTIEEANRRAIRELDPDDLVESLFPFLRRIYFEPVSRESLVTILEEREMKESDLVSLAEEISKELSGSKK